MMPTPDQTAPKPAAWGRVWRPLVVFAGLLAGGLLLGYGMGRLLGHGQAARPLGLRGLGALAGLPVVLGLTLLVHELGHVFGGRLVGFRFLLLIVGPFKVTGGRAGLRFGLNRNWALAGGLTACLPTDLRQINRRLLVMVAAGPVASLLLAAAGLTVQRFVTSSSPWDVWSLALGWGSLAIAGATLIPVSTAGYLTDGAQLLSLVRQDATARQRALMLALQAESINGTRPRAWSRPLLDGLLAESPTPSLQALAQLLAYYVALDQNDIATAAARLSPALALAPQLPRGMAEAAYLEAAYFYAAHQHDAAAARRFLALSAGNLAEPHSRLRAEAAVLICEGDTTAGRALAVEALKRAAHAFDRGSAEAEAAWIERDLLARFETG